MMGEDTKKAIELLNNSMIRVADSVDKLKDIVTDVRLHQTSMHGTLKSVEEQAMRTNGRVTQNEKTLQVVKEAHLKCNINQLSKDIEDLKQADKKFAEETIQARYAQKFPNQVRNYMIGLGVSILTIVLGFIYSLKKLDLF